MSAVPERLYDRDSLLEQGFSLLAKSNSLDILSYLPNEIIHDIVVNNKPVDSLSQLKGSFGQFQSKVVNDGEWYSCFNHDYFGVRGKLEQIDQLHQLEIEEVVVYPCRKEDCSECWKTLPLILRGWYKTISFDLDEFHQYHNLKTVLENAPRFISATEMWIFRVDDDEITEPVVNFARRFLFQERKDKLFFNVHTLNPKLLPVVQLGIEALQKRKIKTLISNVAVTENDVKAAFEFVNEEHIEFLEQLDLNHSCASIEELAKQAGFSYDRNCNKWSTREGFKIWLTSEYVCIRRE
ncbi:hypothetical protein L596_017793 [Steinernema carpocapsae]|uniref:Uncharacterized protein n=1 Tax=Steinernema carpocapsae TaxID=34508 RepID=A0A4U5N344_STECR|nr:hypothetical protein L596_017793 [Steinernema carpocapsae]